MNGHFFSINQSDGRKVIFYGPKAERLIQCGGCRRWLRRRLLFRVEGKQGILRCGECYG